MYFSVYAEALNSVEQIKQIKCTVNEEKSKSTRLEITSINSSDFSCKGFTQITEFNHRFCQGTI